MKRIDTSKHEFALYYPELEHALMRTSFVISNKDLIHRIERILRLAVGDTCVLFNEHQHARVAIESINRSEAKVTVESIEANVKYQPHITCGLPLLKRTALEESVYGLVECGINAIQLITTAKTQRSWGGDKEVVRLRKIIIAAAEQSKHYAFPQLHEPISLDAYLKNYSSCDTKLFFDPQGDSAGSIVRDAKDGTVCMMVGPEGDLTTAEKKEIKTSGYQFIRLTPTVLRAQQAVVVAAGLVRSLK